MRYRDVRALFAQLPADGRLTLHLAFRQTYPSPWAADAVAPSWTVVVRDNARLPLPGTDVRYLYRVADGVGLAGLDDRAVVAGLCILDTTADPTCRLTWSEVLRVLDGISEAFPTWQIEAIVGTLEPESRYGVTLRTEAGAARPLPNYEAFDRLCLEAGPFGQRAPLPDVPAVAAGAPLSTWEPGPGGGTAAPLCRQEPVTAWVFTPARLPRCCTLGGLPWLAPSSVCTWVDLCAPSRDELLAVARQLCLPYRAALATLSSAPESWCRAYPDHISVRVPVARRDPLSGRIEADPLDLLVGRAVVVSVHARPLPALIRLRRWAGQNPDCVGAAAPVLLSALLGEVLSSEEAVVRWVAHDSVALQGHVRRMADLRHAQQVAVALQQIVERRHALLAEADRLARQLHGRALLPSWGDVEDRRTRFRAALRQFEETADGGLRLLGSRARPRWRVRRAGCPRVWAACAVAVLASLWRSDSRARGR